MLACSCAHDDYKPNSPYQSLLIEEDVSAKVSFPATMADGTKQRVESTQVLRAGGVYVFLTAEQMQRYLTASTQPATRP